MVWCQPVQYPAHAPPPGWYGQVAGLRPPVKVVFLVAGFVTNPLVLLMDSPPPSCGSGARGCMLAYDSIGFTNGFEPPPPVEVVIVVVRLVTNPLVLLMDS